jgi:hypothetical protein
MSTFLSRLSTRLLITLLLGAGVAGGALAAPAERQEGAGAGVRRPTPARSQFSLGVSLVRAHDDNVIQLTRQNLDLFTNRPGAPRFLIAQVGDMQTVTEGALRWRGRPWARRDTRLEFDATAHRYDVDHVVDWQQYEWTGTQDLTSSRRQSLSLSVFANRIPRYYLGEVTELEASVASGRRVRQSLTYEQTGTGVRLRQQLLRGRMAFTGGLEHMHREYNPHFAERTNNNDQWRLQAEASPWRSWDASLRVTWLKGSLRARGNIPDSLDIAENDISYDHDGIGLALTLPWGRADWRGRLDASLMPEVRTYNTGDKFDILRFGRENHRRDVRLRVTQGVWGPIDAVVTWQRLTSRARFNAGITFPPEQTNFDQEQFGVMLRLRADLPVR